MMSKPPGFPCQSMREKGEGRGLGEVQDSEGGRQLQINTEEDRRRLMERQQQEFLNVLRGLLPGNAAALQSSFPGVGEGLGCPGNAERAGLPTRGVNRDVQASSTESLSRFQDNLLTARNFPLLRQMSVPCTATVTRVSSMNPGTAHSDSDPPAQQAKDALVLPAEVSQEVASSTGGNPSSQQCLVAAQTDSPDKPASSSEEEDEDVEKPMTEQHRELLTLSRTQFVDDLTPDEIFNILISEKIFTPADINRIKGSNRTREQMNEELLDHLTRRPDRAFHVFKKALEKTLQNHLSDLLNPHKNPQFKAAQKRKTNSTASCPSTKRKNVLPSANSASFTSSAHSGPTISGPAISGPSISGSSSASASTVGEAPPSQSELMFPEFAIRPVTTGSFPLYSGASLAPKASEGAKKASPVHLNRQESMTPRFSQEEATNSVGTCPYGAFGSYLPSALQLQLPPTGNRHLRQSFHGSSCLHADQAVESEAGSQAPVYEEAEAREAGLGGSGSQQEEEEEEEEAGSSTAAAYQELESCFMEMARHAYAQLAPRDGSAEAFNQFMVEHRKTNDHLMTTAQLLGHLREICQRHPNHST